MILIVDMNLVPLAQNEFVRPLVDIIKSLDRWEVRHFTDVDSVDGYDRIILSGTPLMDVDYLDRLEEFGWLKECNVPVLGICAGMQVLASVFGSRMVRDREIGMTDIETTVDNTLFSGSFRAYALHSLAVEPSGDFDVIARSERCVQGIRHREKPLYGVLFHPEVRNKGIIERFVKMKDGGGGVK